MGQNFGGPVYMYPPSEIEKKLNLGDVRHAPLKLGSQVVRRSVRTFKGVYDFALQGGAIGTIQLYDAMLVEKAQPQLLGKQASWPLLILPPGFIILNGLIDVITAPSTAGSPTIALSSGVNAADLKAATASSSYTGLVATIPVNTAATAIKVPLTQLFTSGIFSGPGSVVSMAIATAALTAGKFNLHLEGYLGD